MSKQFAGVLAAIVLIFVGIILITSHKSTTTTGTKNSSATLTEHTEGSTSSGVTLTEYGDYECPYCEEYYPTVKAVAAEFNTQIVFQFRNFPLVNVHQNAFAGARAAEAAALQNKFWEMHDALYDQADWQVWSTASDPTPDFDQYATQLGLNLTQFKSDFASSKVNDLVNADMAEGTKLNIQGTPSFFLDGKAISPGNDIAQFEKLIKAEIAKKATASAAKTSTTSATTPTTSTTPTVTPVTTSAGN